MAGPEGADALFIAAHPDDGELLAGGLMARLAEAGRRVVLADATRGEMGTRGSAELRAEEAREAARILGVERTNLGLPDGGISSNLDASVREVVKAIRQFRPLMVFTHSGRDHHPDHNGLHTAVRRAFFQANVLKYDTGQERFRPVRLFYFFSGRHLLPERIDFIVDISPVWEKKMASIKAHRSQVQGTGFDGPETYLTNDLTWHRLESRFGYFGSLIDVRYGEAYLTESFLRIDDPGALPDIVRG